MRPDPNGRPAPNIHTWDSHMTYGYLPEMFENFTKLSKLDRFLETLVQKSDQNDAESRYCIIGVA